MSSRYIAVSGDKHIAVFHNVAGYQSMVTELEAKKKTTTGAAMRERLQAQIDDARSVLIQCLIFPEMGSMQFCRGKAEAESSRPRRGRLNSGQGRGETTCSEKPSFP